MRDWDGRGWALLAGLLCGFGNGLQFMGGQAAGYAAADAVQVSFYFTFSMSKTTMPRNILIRSFCEYLLRVKIDYEEIEADSNMLIVFEVC